MPALCHTRKRADDRGVVSPRFDWSAGRPRIRLRNQLSPRAWKRLSSAANRAGMDVERLPQSFLGARFGSDRWNAAARPSATAKAHSVGTNHRPPSAPARTTRWPSSTRRATRVSYDRDAKIRDIRG